MGSSCKLPVMYDAIFQNGRSDMPIRRTTYVNEYRAEVAKPFHPFDEYWFEMMMAERPI